MNVPVLYFKNTRLDIALNFVVHKIAMAHMISHWYNLIYKLCLMNHVINKYLENAKSCKAFVSMYLDEFRGCQKLILFAFS